MLSRQKKKRRRRKKAIWTEQKNVFKWKLFADLEEDHVVCDFINAHLAYWWVWLIILRRRRSIRDDSQCTIIVTSIISLSRLLPSSLLEGHFISAFIIDCVHIRRSIIGYLKLIEISCSLDIAFCSDCHRADIEIRVILDRLELTKMVKIFSSKCDLQDEIDVMHQNSVPFNDMTYDFQCVVFNFLSVEWERVSPEWFMLFSALLQYIISLFAY